MNIYQIKLKLNILYIKLNIKEDKKKNKKNKSIKDPLIEEEDSYGKSEDGNNSFDEGKIKINTNNMGQLLSERKEMIQDFKKISTQVNDLSKTVMIELKKQGEKVDILDNQATKINKNAKNVKTETDETKDISEKNIRKSIWIIVGLVVVVFILIGILNLL